VLIERLSAESSAANSAGNFSASPRIEGPEVNKSGPSKRFSSAIPGPAFSLNQQSIEMAG
jgi:hypothetical protein